MSGDDGYQVGRPDRRAVAAAGRARLLAVLSVAFVVACGGSDNAAGPAGPPSQSPPLSYLALFPARLVAVVGEQITLTVTARDVDGATLGSVAPQYISTNPDVVRIEPGPAGTSGQLLASGVGTATVRASAGGQTAEAIIHVGSASYALALGPPRVLNGNYIDLSKIERVSRFRSTVGHSYTNDTGVETCRSMKHPGCRWTGRRSTSTRQRPASSGGFGSTGEGIRSRFVRATCPRSTSRSSMSAPIPDSSSAPGSRPAIASAATPRRSRCPTSR